MKSLVCCTHFLTQHHISHFTTFTVSCWARELQAFFENANAVYTSLLVGQWLTFSKHLEHGLRGLL